MTFVMHWKATLAMTAAYVAIAVLALAFIRDTMLASILLFIAFFSILFVGNLVLRRRQAMPMRRRGEH
jgi:hypothetical protein